MLRGCCGKAVSGAEMWRCESQWQGLSVWLFQEHWGLSMPGTKLHQHLSHHRLRDAVNEQTSKKWAGQGAGYGSLPRLLCWATPGDSHQGLLQVSATHPWDRRYPQTRSCHSTALVMPLTAFSYQHHHRWSADTWADTCNQSNGSVYGIIYMHNF